jgi:serine/threonine protein kinase
VLADFGLAIEVLDPEQARLTSTSEAVGSRYYIAPENENGVNESVDQRPADFYGSTPRFGEFASVVSRRGDLAM